MQDWNFPEDEDIRERNAIDATLAELVRQAVDGAKDVDEQLATLLESLPQSDREETVQRFRALQQELEKTPETEMELTPEMEAQQRQMEEREHRMMISQWLSEQTLKKIRKALLLNPLLFQSIVNLGEELTKKGVFFETRKTQITNAELGGVALQANLTQNNDKEKDASRSR